MADPGRGSGKVDGMYRKILLVVFVLGMFLMSGSVSKTGAAKEYLAELYDVLVEIQPGGDLLVTETVVFRFEGGPFSFVYRDVPREGSAGLVDITASLDGQPLPPGDEPGQVEIQHGDPTRVTWHFGSVANATRTFTLSYRVISGMRRLDGQDVLDWDALPNDHEYWIEGSRVQVNYPPELTLADEPQVVRGQAQIQQAAGSVTFSATGLEPNTPLEILVRFPEGSLIPAAPAWQQSEQERQIQQAAASRMRQWIPLVGLAGFLLAMAAGLVWVGSYVRSQQDLDRIGTPVVDPAPRLAPPSDLPPAMAGALGDHGVSIGWTNGQGTLLDLARRGVISIEEQPKQGWFGKPDFLLRLNAIPDGLYPHEKTLLDIVFNLAQKPLETIAVSDLSSVLPGRIEQFKEAVRQDLLDADLVSLERQRVRGKLQAVGVVALLLGGVIGLVALIPLFSALARGNWWIVYASGGLMGAAFGILFAGIGSLIAAGRYSNLSVKGMYQNAQWKGFASYLNGVMQGQAGPGRSDLFEQYLPLAAGLGFAGLWAKHFKQQNVTMPPWFHALSQDPSAAMDSFFIAMDSTSSMGDSSSDASGGGGGGDGGGGGGGGSGAG